jgi:hypothetical protein
MGEWKRNRPNGFGFEAYPDGSYYQGTFENDQRDGYDTKRTLDVKLETSDD